MGRWYHVEERKARKRVREGGLEDVSGYVRGLLAGIYESVEEVAGEIGLRVMERVMEAEREELAGARYARDSGRGAYRWASQRGYVVFGGRKVGIRRVRVRGKGGKEIPLESHKRFQQDGKMQRAVVGKLIIGVSQRNVKRWRNEGQVQRWAGTMLVEAEKRFRKVRGYRALEVM